MKILLSITLFFTITAITVAQEVINLAGEWEFKLDPKNQGIEEKWFETASFKDIIRLPGCLQEQGYGNIPNIETEWWGGETMEEWFGERPWLGVYTEASNFKSQEFLVPDRHYLGAAWYATEINIPKGWQQKQVALFLERCHWETKLWVDGKYIGQNRSLGTPHSYSLKEIQPGKHRIVLRVDNSKLVNLGNKPHSVSEQTAGTWNGIVGKLELQTKPAITLDNVQLYPNTESSSVSVKAIITGPDVNEKKWTLDVEVTGVGSNSHQPESLKLKSNSIIQNDDTISFEFPMGNGVQFWDEFTPNLYEMKLSLKQKGQNQQTLYESTQRFGMRNFESSGKHFAINGKKTFIRGNVDCAVFPETGYAPMDVASWKKVFKTYKEFGLNMARFHSWCPPEAAFIAADEMGIYLAPEVGEWVWIGQQDQYDFFSEEAEKILDTYGNHPSFIQMGLGNEANAKKEFSKPIIESWKEKDSRHLYTLKANSKGNPENIEFEVVRGAGKPFERIRYQDGWPPVPENSLFHTEEPNTMVNWDLGVSKTDYPLIQHETAQICAYPDVMNEISKYTGYLNPTYLEIAADQLRERGMLEQLPDFVEASGKWQVELTREEFEAAYRTKDLAGFHWLCLADFTGQNTAPVGFTDAFYNVKPYVNPKKVRNWNAPTVLLASMPKRVYTSLNEFKANILISHFGKQDIDLTVSAELRDETGKLVKSWKLPQQKITQGNAQKLGEITAPLMKIEQPTKLILELKSEDGKLKNEWDLWVFPKTKSKKMPKSITVAKKWDANVAQKLKNGETVLLLPKQEDLKGQLPICFTNYYWTSFGENEGQSSAAGVLIDSEHLIFKDFPTENHVNWQWWDLLTYAHPMILDSYDSKNPWPKSFKPMLQPIDSWKINRKLALLTEVKVGKGKLMICSIDIETALDERPVTNQFRNNLLEYLSSNNFNPKTELTKKTIKEVFSY
ncbi:sugar-binding domain-containing protein [Galbibacter mesophilus]|uniref:sugar-binding domain-containing protein n=1 Tax=Galbibacter mesophilus TaxID=379069 RepID=UPI00191E7397|nr:sugar-binding domain-containing protein [Galbibacter mesophilus]MCM5664038.1 hypothetical protein [Galbibacter mesophilus]